MTDVMTSTGWLVQASVLLIPAAVMTLGESITIGVAKSVQAASQNLSAGIIMGALSSEIQPMIMDLVFQERYSSTLGGRIAAMLAVVCGGVLAIWTNFYVGSLADDTEDGDAKAVCPCLAGDGNNDHHDEESVSASETTSEASAVELSAVTYQATKDAIHDSPGGRASDSFTRMKKTPSVAKHLSKKLIRDLMLRIRDQTQKLNLNGGEDRSTFDDLVHSMERDIHFLLREVSLTPAWTQDERRRVSEHTKELTIAVNELEAASIEIIGNGHDTSSPISSSETLVRYISDVESCLNHLHEHVERSTVKKWGRIMTRGHWSTLSRPAQGGYMSSSGEEDEEDEFSRKPRLVLIFTVTVDAFVDGFLIGLCLVSNFPTALIMAIATSLEMGFLGLAYGSTLNRDLMKAIASIPSSSLAFSETKARNLTRLQLAIPPVVMVLAGMIGVCLGEVLLESTLLFLGMLSFASVSLIFLVTQELIVEARESIESSEDLQCVTIWLFIGLFIAFFMSTVTNDI